MGARRRLIEKGKRGPAGAAHAAATEIDARRLADGATRRDEELEKGLCERREEPAPGGCVPRRPLTRHGSGF